jgi:hypothetical protein
MMTSTSCPYGWHHDLLLWADHGGAGPTTTRYIRERSAAARTSRSTTIRAQGFSNGSYCLESQPPEGPREWAPGL